LLIGSSNRAFEVNGRVFSLLSIADLKRGGFASANGHSFVHIVDTVYIKQRVKLSVFFIRNPNPYASEHPSAVFDSAD